MITKPWARGHKHILVTHYQRPAEEVTHFRGQRTPTNTSIPVSHDHESQEDPDKQHLWDGHVNDQARPEASPG